MSVGFLPTCVKYSSSFVTVVLFRTGWSQATVVSFTVLFISGTHPVRVWMYFPGVVQVARLQRATKVCLWGVEHTLKAAKIKKIVITRLHIAEMSNAAKLLWPFYIFGIFLLFRLLQNKLLLPRFALQFAITCNELFLQGGPKSYTNNIRKCTPILIIFHSTGNLWRIKAKITAAIYTFIM